MNRILFLMALAILAVSGPADAILGDLDRDGAVGFLDFFLFADNFGKEGPPDPLPDTVRIEIFDTTYVEQVVQILDTTYVEQTIFDTTYVQEIVQVLDTTRITLRDTVVVIDPVVGEYTTWEQVSSAIDIEDPIHGLRRVYIRHYSDTFRLGPDLPRREHQLFSMGYYEDGKIYTKTYLKPSGHLIKKRVNSYSVEVLYVEDRYIELIFDQEDNAEEIRYLYDTEMNVIDENFSSYWGGEKEWWYLTLRDDGDWDIEYSRDCCSSAQTLGTYTYTPLDFERELTR